MANEIAHKTAQQGEIILYQPDETVRLEVRLEDDTVWLTQAQIVALFQKAKSTISFHISNIFKEGELDENVVVRKNRTTTLHGAIDGKKQTHEVAYYNLDVIISVGYRVKSLRGTKFRQWATGIIREHLLHGYSVQQQLRYMEHRLDEKLDAQQSQIKAIESTLADHQEKIDFFVRTNQPPVEGIFYDGQIFDAYRFVSELIRKAKNRIILIDNYVDETVQEHFNRAHDRFLLIDDEVYHIGASLKDLGKKWFAFTLMHDLSATELISRISGSATA
jgi:hypothetical protein